jgi:phospholipid/cholesterol/gamma-HCH transport system ATP-binding protein
MELVLVRKKFGDREILRGVDLRVRRGTTTCIIGGSGSGKSVMLKLMSRLLEPDQGKILFLGRDIAHAEGRELAEARRKMGVLFQSGGLLQSLTVGENVALPLRESTGLDDDEIERRVTAKLELLEVADAKDRLPKEISGGMLKRVALARAVILEPEVVLYDEPTSGLDPVKASLVDEMIQDMKSALDVTQIVVTHSMKSVSHIADRVALLFEGVIAFDGTADELRDSDDPVVQQFVTGRAKGPIGTEV